MRSDVYNCDCIAYMKGLPDKTIDLIVADPPYGISAISVEPWKQAVTNPRGVKMRNRIKQGAGKLKNRVIQNLDSDFDFEPPTQEFLTSCFACQKTKLFGEVIISDFHRQDASFAGISNNHGRTSHSLSWHGPASILQLRCFVIATRGGVKNTSILLKNRLSCIRGYSRSSQSPAILSLILCSGVEVQGSRLIKWGLILSDAKSTRSISMLPRSASGVNASEKPHSAMEQR